MPLMPMPPMPTKWIGPMSRGNFMFRRPPPMMGPLNRALRHRLKRRRCRAQDIKSQVLRFAARTEAGWAETVRHGAALFHDRTLDAQHRGFRRPVAAERG